MNVSMHEKGARERTLRPRQRVEVPRPHKDSHRACNEGAGRVRRVQGGPSTECPASNIKEESLARIGGCRGGQGDKYGGAIRGVKLASQEMKIGSRG